MTYINLASSIIHLSRERGEAAEGEGARRGDTGQPLINHVNSPVRLKARRA